MDKEKDAINAIDFSGLISTKLENDILTELQRHGIIVWLDRYDEYSDYVDTLIERHKLNDFPFPVVAFRGSYLSMLLELESHCNGTNIEPLLIHAPGHTEETIRKTPLLEWYAAGHRYRRALKTLVSEVAAGRVIPDKINAFLTNKKLSLINSELWLKSEIALSKDGLSAFLESLQLEWIVDGLLSDTKKLREKIKGTKDVDTLLDFLHRHTGLDRYFLFFFIERQNVDFSPISETFFLISETFAAWLMCVEYVNDLSRKPHLKELQSILSLPKLLLRNNERLIQYFKEHHPDEYTYYSSIAEARLQKEIDAIAPEDLGKIDTFKREEERILEETIHSLLKSKWGKALQWTRHRTDATSFWLQRDPARRIVWKLASKAAAFGNMLEKSNRLLPQKHSLEDALYYYTNEGNKIDNAHRHFEQSRLKLLDSNLPYFGRLLEISNNLRRFYRQWADVTAEDFTSICEREGFLPKAEQQQRNLYNNIVHPLIQSNHRIAYFLIDAFRYEMVSDILTEFDESSGSIKSEGLFCELPSITSIGMNALAPLVKDGKLNLTGENEINGLKTGEYLVRTMDDRIRAMSDKSIDDKTKEREKTRKLLLNDVCSWSTQKLKNNCKGVKLLIVHSHEIDDAGEANVGLACFETWIAQIKTASNHLRSIGINQFILTSDHGFMLQDNTTEQIKYGNKRTPKRRYIYAENARLEQGMTSVSLRSLNYEGKEGYLLFRRDTAVFDTGKPNASFTHGGNSLQERIIPVLTVSYKNIPKVDKVNYQINTEVMPHILGYNRMKISAKSDPSSEPMFDFIKPAKIILSLRVPNRPDIIVNIKDVTGAELLNQNQISLNKDEAVEVIFDITGSRDEKVKLEIYHPDNPKIAESFITEAYYNVSGNKNVVSPQIDSAKDDYSWQNSFEDELVCNVFKHIENYGSINEEELINMLGSSRKARRFANNFEKYQKKIPFNVKIETTGKFKRYIKIN